MDSKPWSGLRAWIYSFIFRAPKSNRLVVSLAELSPSDRALDIGCGPGAAVRMAADIVVEGEAIGVDRAPAMIDIARKRSTAFPNTRFEVGSAESLPFPDGEFTVIWTAHSFHHWEDRRTGLAEMVRVLADGGRALILEQHGKKHGLTDAEAEAVTAELETAGFSDISVDRVDKQVVISAVNGSPILGR